MDFLIGFGLILFIYAIYNLIRVNSMEEQRDLASQFTIVNILFTLANTLFVLFILYKVC